MITAAMAPTMSSMITATTPPATCRVGTAHRLLYIALMPRRALIVSGGWEGHQPQAIAAIFHRMLRDENFQVELSNSLDSFADEKYLQSLSLIVPNWTMGKITDQQLKGVLAAV